jgi:hypothetical protein
MVVSGKQNHWRTYIHGERRDNSVKNVHKPLKQYPRDAEGIIDPVKVTTLRLSFYLILPSFHSTFYSLD